MKSFITYTMQTDFKRFQQVVMKFCGENTHIFIQNITLQNKNQSNVVSSSRIREIPFKFRAL